MLCGSKCLKSRDQTPIEGEPECLHHLEDNFRKREHLESVDRRDCKILYWRSCQQSVIDDQNL